MATEDVVKSLTDPAQRHCSFCLKFLPYKLCGGCRRRAYCSATCQKEDWLPSGKGQGHKNWCKLEHGQEDIDWEIRPVPGKGLGIVAKRPIPAMYRIIVEGVHYEPDSHPAIADFSPESGTLQQKFNDNSIAGHAEYQQGRKCLALRICRANHSCAPNAGHIYCETSKVGILHAYRDIQEGEEICISYVTFNDLLNAGSSIKSRMLIMKTLLYMQYGITCPSDCRCKNPEFQRSLETLKQLNADFERLKISHPIRALNITEEILALMKQWNYPWSAQARAHGMAYPIGKFHPSVRHVCLEHLKKVQEINEALVPLSLKTRKANELLQAHQNEG